MRKILGYILILFLSIYTLNSVEAQNVFLKSSSGFIDPGKIIDGNTRSFAYLEQRATGEIILEISENVFINELNENKK